MNPKTPIVFFQVKNNQEKLSAICQTAREYFEKKQHLLMLVPDLPALEFVDTLLWRFPEESFLPHMRADQLGYNPIDYIALTHTRFNPNKAIFFFNLCPHPLFLEDPVKLIYELDDHTSKEKAEASQNRYQAYRLAGHPISFQ